MSYFNGCTMRLLAWCGKIAPKDGPRPEPTPGGCGKATNAVAYQRRIMHNRPLPAACRIIPLTPFSLNRMAIARRRPKIADVG